MKSRAALARTFVSRRYIFTSLTWIDSTHHSNTDRTPSSPSDPSPPTPTTPPPTTLSALPDAGRLICTLPTELVCIIIQEFVQLDHRHRNRPSSKLSMLSRLNRAWNEFIYATPSIWCFVSGNELNAYPLVAKANPTHPLYFRSGGRGAELKEFLGFVHNHLDRCASLELMGEHSSLDEEDATALSAAMPLLNTLRLASRLENRDRYVIDLSGPKLVHLHLHGIAVPWTGLNRPSNLHSLSLIRMQNVAPSTQRLANFLCASPALEELQLLDVNVSDNVDDEDPEAAPFNSPIALPFLRKLCLKNGNGSRRASIYLSTRIDAPNCHILEVQHISTDPSHTNAHTPNNKISTITARPMLSSSARITVKYDDQVLVSVESSPDSRVPNGSGLQRPYVDFQVTLSWITEEWEEQAQMMFLPRNNPYGHITFGRSDAEFQPRHLEFWTGTSSISFKSDYQDIRVALRSLAMPPGSQIPHTTDAWICPCLTDLSFSADIRGSKDIDEVFRSVMLVLEARNMVWEEIDTKWVSRPILPDEMASNMVPSPIRFISGPRALTCRLEETAFAAALVLKVAH